MFRPNISELAFGVVVGSGVEYELLIQPLKHEFLFNSGKFKLNIHQSTC